ncbi:DNA-binding transcriptional regulator, AcrR family [Lentzea waywayandensis]|uniref:DNA-binding transcriptional regulator, AcrR family n=1 Tax=Lentzea waywayandensis TaxID=84724 RepID=A0A1I6FHK5_9PSEU|nr:TetR/AcrR family transcriptional regulator [Lentzea waywayandensis]SFR29431.1 DNA-binding transcriptional regulator, AcrR family [Lentzea waywayandensis]
MNEEVKRSYSSPLREQAAAQTRLLVRAAGHRLFVRDGFVATSIRKIAAEAGVSERTVYTHYRNKVELFQDALNVAIAGDEEPVAMRDRPEFEEVLAAPSARDLIAGMVRRNGVVQERAGALIMAGIESSGADPDMRRISDEGEHAMRANCLALAEALVATGEVREELDAAGVADVLTTMASPHVHQILGWPADRYRDWLAGTLAASLLKA